MNQRDVLCRKADADLREAICDWMERHPDLTWCEAVQIMADLVARIAKHPVQDERRKKQKK